MRISAVQLLHEKLIQAKAEHLENAIDGTHIVEIIRK